MTQPSATYTVAVAGLGKRGMHHADAFAANSRFCLVGLCDLDPARLEAAQQKYGEVNYASTNAVQMLTDTRPDIFAFCTLPQIRLPLIQAGVEAGVKLIAYEKPIATSTHEALEMYRLLRESGVKSVVSTSTVMRALSKSERHHRQRRDWACSYCVWTCDGMDDAHDDAPDRVYVLV
jgi:predicted dehydrogenase